MTAGARTTAQRKMHTMHSGRVVYITRAAVTACREGVVLGRERWARHLASPARISTKSFHLPPEFDQRSNYDHLPKHAREQVCQNSDLMALVEDTCIPGKIHQYLFPSTRQRKRDVKIMSSSHATTRSRSASPAYPWLRKNGLRRWGDALTSISLTPASRASPLEESEEVLSEGGNGMDGGLLPRHELRTEAAVHEEAVGDGIGDCDDGASGTNASDGEPSSTLPFGRQSKSKRIRKTLARRVSRAIHEVLFDPAMPTDAAMPWRVDQVQVAGDGSVTIFWVPTGDFAPMTPSERSSTRLPSLGDDGVSPTLSLNREEDVELEEELSSDSAAWWLLDNEVPSLEPDVASLAIMAKTIKSTLRHKLKLRRNEVPRITFMMRDTRLESLLDIVASEGAAKAGQELATTADLDLAAAADPELTDTIESRPSGVPSC